MCSSCAFFGADHAPWWWRGPLKQLTAVKSAMCWGHFEWAWALPRKSNRNLCDLNFSACIKCLKNKIYDRQYCIPSPQAATSLSLNLTLTLSLKVLQGAQSLWNRHEIYAFANWQQQQVDNMRLNLWNIVFSPSTRALSHVPQPPPSQLLAPGCSLLFAFGNFQLLIFQSVRTLLQLREAYWKYLSWPRIRIRIRMRNGNENSKAMADGGMANANATPSSLVSVSLSLSLGLYVFVCDRQRAKTLEKLSESVWEGVRTRS